MSRVQDTHWSKTGDGQDRLTKNYTDGSSRDITRRKDGSITVTDTNSNGCKKTGDGATGILGSLSSATRVNTKSESGNSGCYLSSACAISMGLPDDCIELTILRDFRDNFMLNSKKYCNLVTKYYAMAPAIVNKIDSMENAKSIWKKIYDELVIPSVNLIESKKYTAAAKYYKKYTEALAKILA